MIQRLFIAAPDMILYTHFAWSVRLGVSKQYVVGMSVSAACHLTFISAPKVSHHS